VIQVRGPAQELRATIDRLPLHVRQGVLDGIKGQRIIAGAHADGSGGVCPMVAADVPWKSVSHTSIATAQEAARAWDRYAQASGSSRTATKRQLLALTSMLEASILQETAHTDMSLYDAIAEYERARSRGRGAPAPLARDAVPMLPRDAVPDLPRDAVPDMPVARPRYLALADAYEVPADDPSPRELPAAPPTSLEAPAARPSEREVTPELPSPVEAAPKPPRPVDVPSARPTSRKRRRDTGERDRTAELGERDGWAWMRPFRSYDEYEATLLRALEELDTHERQLEESRVR
jgi:hypothetical protein